MSTADKFPLSSEWWSSSMLVSSSTLDILQERTRVKQRMKDKARGCLFLSVIIAGKRCRQLLSVLLGSKNSTSALVESLGSTLSILMRPPNFAWVWQAVAEGTLGIKDVADALVESPGYNFRPWCGHLTLLEYNCCEDQSVTDFERAFCLKNTDH